MRKYRVLILSDEFLDKKGILMDFNYNGLSISGYFKIKVKY